LIRLCSLPQGFAGTLVDTTTLDLPHPTEA
jgi:hypothetical protein